MLCRHLSNDNISSTCDVHPLSGAIAEAYMDASGFIVFTVPPPWAFCDGDDEEEVEVEAFLAFVPPPSLLDPSVSK